MQGIHRKVMNNLSTEMTSSRCCIIRQPSFLGSGWRFYTLYYNTTCYLAIWSTLSSEIVCCIIWQTPIPPRHPPPPQKTISVSSIRDNVYSKPSPHYVQYFFTFLPGDNLSLTRINQGTICTFYDHLMKWGKPPKVLGPTFACNVVYLVDKELCCFGHTFGHKFGYDWFNALHVLFVGF